MNVSKSTLIIVNKILFKVYNCQRFGFKSSIKKIKHNGETEISHKSQPSSPNQSNLKVLIKPFGFTIAICSCSFVTASIIQYESLRSKVTNKFKDPISFYGKSGSIRQQINNYWNSLLPGAKVIYSLITANAIVFLLWRIPKLQPIMLKYFLSSTSSPSWSLLCSAFSHHSGFHLFINMYVLLSFSNAIVAPLGSEQFIATYISAATISGFTSLVVKVIKKTPIPSLGASGSVLAVIGMVGTLHPNSRMSIAFLDQIYPHSFSADSAIKGLMLFDFVGLMLGWRLFDHAAHLGGILFGIWYAKYGNQLIWQKREFVVKAWHKLRGPP